MFTDAKGDASILPCVRHMRPGGHSVFQSVPLCVVSWLNSTSRHTLISYFHAVKASHTLLKIEIKILPDQQLYSVSQKTVQNCFCQNFVKFPPVLIIFSRKMVKRLLSKLVEIWRSSDKNNFAQFFWDTM